MGTLKQPRLDPTEWRTLRPAVPPAGRGRARPPPVSAAEAPAPFPGSPCIGVSPTHGAARRLAPAPAWGWRAGPPAPGAERRGGWVGPPSAGGAPGPRVPVASRAPRPPPGAVPTAGGVLAPHPTCISASGPARVPTPRGGRPPAAVPSSPPSTGRGPFKVRGVPGRRALAGLGGRALARPGPCADWLRGVECKMAPREL